MVLRFFLSLCFFGLLSTAHASDFYVGQTQRGLATWYGADLNGRPTANGETFNKDALTAAHRTLPFNSVVEVRNPRNGRTVQVRINDRGPFGKAERIIDLSEAAARQIGLIDQGTIAVQVRVLKIGRRKHAGGN